MSFSDADVLSDSFLETLKECIEVLAPFVQLVNEVRLILFSLRGRTLIHLGQMVEPTPDDDDDE